MSYSHFDHPTGGLPPAYIGPHKIPDIGETRCYWALLSSNLQFLYMDPVLVYHLQGQARTLYGKSLLMFIHPDDRRVAEADLRDCLSDTVQHGSVTRVRFQRLSRVRRELGHEHQYTPWSEASKIALDPNYMAVDIVINWAADGLVLCFMHAVKDLTPSDNDKYHKTPWTNWCGNVGLDDTRLAELASRLERCAPEMPPSSVEGITKVFQILRNEPSNAHMPDRGLLVTWPPDSPALHHHHHHLRRGYGQVATARDLAGISNEMQAGLAADTDARTNCTKRTQTTRDLPLGRVESVLVGYGPILFACHKIIMHHVPSSSSMSSSSSSSPSSYAPPPAAYGAPQPPPPPLPPPSEHALVLPPPHPYHHHDEAPPLHGSGSGGGGGNHPAHHSRGYTTGPGVMTPPIQARHPSDYPLPLSWHPQQQQQHSEPPPPPPQQSQSRYSNQGQAPWTAAPSQSHMRSFRVSFGASMYGAAGGSESAGMSAMVTDDPAPSAPGPASHHSAAAGAGVPYERDLQQQHPPHRYPHRPPSDEQPSSHAMVPHHHHHHQQQQQYSSVHAPPAIPSLPPPSVLAPLPPSSSLPPVQTLNQTRKRSPASPTLDGPGVPTSRRRTNSEGGYGASAGAGSQPTASSGSPGASGGGGGGGGAGNVAGQAPEAPPPLPSRGGAGSGGTNDGGGGGSRGVSGMQCAHCKTTTSPEWRKGPSGKKELCNACGLRFARSKAKSNGATAQNGVGKKRKAAASGGGGIPASAPPLPSAPGVVMKQDPSLDLPLPAPSVLHHHQQQQQQGLAPALPPLDNSHIMHPHHQQPQPQHNHQQVRRRGSSFYSNEDGVPAYAAGSAATSSGSYLPSPHEYHHQPQHHQHPSHARHSLSPRLFPLSDHVPSPSAPPSSVPSSAPSEHYYYALPPPSHLQQQHQHQHPQHHREYSGYRLDSEGEGTRYHGTPLSTSYERETRSGSGGGETEDGRLSASA